MFPLKLPCSHLEFGIALPQLTGAGAGVGSGYAVGAYDATGLVKGTAIPQSSGQVITFIIGCATLAGVTSIGFGVQGTNDDLSGSPTWANVAPQPTVQSGNFPSVSTAILGFWATSGTRTPPDGPALTTAQVAIENERLTRFAANKQLIFSVDTARTGYKHHRLVIFQITGAAAPVFATWTKSNLRDQAGRHPYAIGVPIKRPPGFTDAQWATYRTTGVVPSGVTDQEALSLLSSGDRIYRAPIRPGGLSDAQWDTLRACILEEGIHLQHLPDTVYAT